MYVSDKHVINVGIIINYLDVGNINIHDYFYKCLCLMDTREEN